MTKAKPFTVRIYYEDTDAGGLVYHSNYFRYAERARTEWLHEMGIFHKDLAKLPQPVGFALRECGAEFFKPAVLEDELVVKTKIVELKGATCKIVQKFYNKGELSTVVTVRLVCIGINDMKPKRYPDIFVKAAKEELEKNKGE